ncbi:GIY-YIG nuclease family protein [Yersinia enterocolitica]|uniref:GIY-YIG nuclease family protein n=1 Tax=Yersinia enterocolitica TaxID=630 RepID=UPI003F41B7BE
MYDDWVLLGYKIGITNLEPEQRLKQIQHKSELHHSIVWSFKLTDGGFIRKLEKVIHDECYHVDLSSLVKEGHTEIISVCEIDKAFSIIRISLLEGTKKL